MTLGYAPNPKSGGQCPWAKNVLEPVDTKATVMRKGEAKDHPGISEGSVEVIKRSRDHRFKLTKFLVLFFLPSIGVLVGVGRSDPFCECRWIMAAPWKSRQVMARIRTWRWVWWPAQSWHSMAFLCTQREATCWPGSNRRGRPQIKMYRQEPNNNENK